MNNTTHINAALNTLTKELVGEAVKNGSRMRPDLLRNLCSADAERIWSLLPLAEQEERLLREEQKLAAYAAKRAAAKAADAAWEAALPGLLAEASASAGFIAAAWAAAPTKDGFEAQKIERMALSRWPGEPLYNTAHGLVTA